jgi:hypothetical protein
MLTRPDPEIYKAMGVDINKTGMTDIIKSVGGAMGYIFSHPWTTYKDSNMVDRIAAAQAQFLRDNADTLGSMDDEMSAVTQSLAAMADLFKKTDLQRGKLDELMNQKATCGNAVYNDLSNQIDQTSDPDRRAALERMRSQLDDWMRERDSRITNEQATVTGLGDRLDVLASEIARQRQAVEDARRSMGPVNTTTSGGAILDSSHIRPEAINYARGLRDLLAGSRARLDRAMSSGSR